MKSLSKREKVLLIALLLVGITFLYYTYYLAPALNSISALEDSVDNYKLDANNIIRIEASNKKQRDQIKDLKVKYETSVKALPKIERNPEITYELKKSMDSNNIMLVSASFAQASAYKGQQAKTEDKNPNEGTKEPQKQENASSTKLMVVPVNLNISGSYTDIVKLIETFEKSNRITEVTSVVITRDDSDPPLKLKASLNLNYYYAESGSATEENYDFNKDKYGKNDIFQ